MIPDQLFKSILSQMAEAERLGGQFIVDESMLLMHAGSEEQILEHHQQELMRSFAQCITEKHQAQEIMAARRMPKHPDEDPFRVKYRSEVIVVKPEIWNQLLHLVNTLRRQNKFQSFPIE